MNWLLPFIPPLAVAAFITAGETLFKPARTDWWRNLQSWALQAGVGFTILPLFNALQVPSLIDGAALPFWAVAAGYLVVRDGLEYLFHRAQHSVPLLWSMHAVHHSDPEMSALTTQRHFWGDPIFKAATIWPMAAMVISPTMEALAFFNMVSLWNFFVHARLPINFGRFSWVLNSAAYHRRHHSLLPEHYNSNFAALLPIFDVISGTYYRPDGYPPTGLDTKPESMMDLLLWPFRQDREPAEPALATNQA